MSGYRPSRSVLFSLLNEVSCLDPDLEPLRNDSTDDLLEKYFYWVDEYNGGRDPRHYARPEYA